MEKCYTSYTIDEFYDKILEKSDSLVSEYFNVNTEYLSLWYRFENEKDKMEDYEGAIIGFRVSIEDLNKKYKIFSDEEMLYMLENDIATNIRVSQGFEYDDFSEYNFEINFENYYIDSCYEGLEDKLDNLICNNGLNKYNNSPFVQDIIKMNKELIDYAYSIMEK